MDEPSPIDFRLIAEELKLTEEQVRNVTALLDEGNTVPFITRYRKERTGNLDEEQIRDIQKLVHARRQIAERAQTILRLIDTQGKLTPKLQNEILQADSLKRLDDLYLPFRPKRTSRANQARERGLAPFAEAVWNQDPTVTSLEAIATAFIDAAKELPDADAVLQGVADILAERISEDADVRARCRRIAGKTGRLEVAATKKGKQSGSEYRDYFDYSEAVDSIPPHRTLALNRGEKSGALRVKFTWDEPRANTELLIFLRVNDHKHPEFMQRCLSDAVSRIIGPSLEREIRREMQEAAEAHAISVFARNLRNLLLQPPLKGKRVLAIDPGFRTGCKTAVLDEYGNCLATDVVYVTGSEEKRAGSLEKLAGLLKEHNIELIAIGNGTACRETEELVTELIQNHAPEMRYLIVNEAGASIYSTSAVARTEFPELDATVRGTISIGRRLLDPLSELVKIEPQHIGVGMYQHDINSKRLKESLDEVVESCVNFVGVNVNTASASLLRYVSGFNQLIARRVVEWREQNGRFATREQLKDVPGIGDATFTQAAGFLKISDGGEALDSTWIHPESYPATRTLLERLEISPEELLSGNQSSEQRHEKFRELDKPALAAELSIGLPTLQDILEALARPGRDPRGDLPGPVFKQGILKLDDLTEDMELRGTILNVVDFGAFVDVGLKDSGLIHISQLANRYIASPHEVVSVGDIVTVWVLGIDGERKRVSLSLLSPEQRAAGPETKPPKKKRKRKPRRRKKPVGQAAASSTAPAEQTSPSVGESQASEIVSSADIPSESLPIPTPGASPTQELSVAPTAEPAASQEGCPPTESKPNTAVAPPTDETSPSEQPSN